LRLVQDTPRLLARNSTAITSLGVGYTDDPAKAMHDEPEAISVADQLVITERCHRQAKAIQQAEWQVRRERIQAEIDWLYSQRFTADVAKALRTLRRQLAHIDKIVTQ
jgi:hypothetical protein